MKTILLLLLLSASLLTHSQTPSDTIGIKKIIFGHAYQINGKNVKHKTLKLLLLSQADSKFYFRKYQGENLAAWGLGLPAALLFNRGQNELPYGRYYQKVNPYYLTAGILFSAGVYYIFHSNKQKYRAVKAYNKSKKAVTF
jgi:hypothetical protein